jgi:hypothetical protein
MAAGADDAHPVQGERLRPITLGWVLRRSLAGIAILMIAMGGLAWLTYASIDPDLDGDTNAQSATVHRPDLPKAAPVGL